MRKVERHLSSGALIHSNRARAIGIGAYPLTGDVVILHIYKLCDVGTAQVSCGAISSRFMSNETAHRHRHCFQPERHCRRW